MTTKKKAPKGLANLTESAVEQSNVAGDIQHGGISVNQLSEEVSNKKSKRVNKTAKKSRPDRGEDLREVDTSRMKQNTNDYAPMPVVSSLNKMESKRSSRSHHQETGLASIQTAARNFSDYVGENSERKGSPRYSRRHTTGEDKEETNPKAAKLRRAVMAQH